MLACELGLCSRRGAFLASLITRPPLFSLRNRHAELTRSQVQALKYTSADFRARRSVFSFTHQTLLRSTARLGRAHHKFLQSNDTAGESLPSLSDSGGCNWQRTARKTYAHTDEAAGICTGQACLPLPAPRHHSFDREGAPPQQQQQKQQQEQQAAC